MFNRTFLVLFFVGLVLSASAADSTNRLQFPTTGFSIAPLETSGAPSPMTLLAMSLESRDGFASNVNVYIQRYAGSIQEYTDLSLGQFKTMDLKVIQQNKKGTAAVVFEYTGSLGGRPMHWYARAEKSDDRVFLVTATAASERWATDAPHLKSCVDSFRVGKEGVGDGSPKTTPPVR